MNLIKQLQFRQMTHFHPFLRSLYLLSFVVQSGVAFQRNYEYYPWLSVFHLHIHVARMHFHMFWLLSQQGCQRNIKSDAMYSGWMFMLIHHNVHSAAPLTTSIALLSRTSDLVFPTVFFPCNANHHHPWRPRRPRPSSIRPSIVHRMWCSSVVQSLSQSFPEVGVTVDRFGDFLNAPICPTQPIYKHKIRQTCYQSNEF